MNCVLRRVRSKTNWNMEHRLFYGCNCPVLRLAMLICFLAVCNLTPTGAKTRAWDKHPPYHDINLTIRKSIGFNYWVPFPLTRRPQHFLRMPVGFCCCIFILATHSLCQFRFSSLAQLASWVASLKLYQYCFRSDCPLLFIVLPCYCDMSAL